MRVTGSPWTCTVPAVAGSSPETSDRVVDLPHPVGPTIETNSPAATSRSTSRIAVKPAPSLVGNLLVAPRNEIACVFWVMPEDRTDGVTAVILLRALWPIPAQTP